MNKFKCCMTAVCGIVMLTQAYAGDYTVEVGYVMSDFKPEAQVDRRFDEHMYDGTRESVSSTIFNLDCRNGYMISFYKDITPKFDAGVFIRGNDRIRGDSNYGGIDARQDSIGLFALGTLLESKHTYFQLGGYVTYTEARVHSWVNNGVLYTVYDEYHDRYTDFSVGPMIKAGIKLTDSFDVSYSVIHNLGDVDVLGQSNVQTIGLSYHF